MGGTFKQDAKYLADKALKATHSLFDVTKDVETPVHVVLQLCDSLVVSILYYGCNMGIFKLLKH